MSCFSSRISYTKLRNKMFRRAYFETTEGRNLFENIK